LPALPSRFVRVLIFFFLGASAPTSCGKGTVDTAPVDIADVDEPVPPDAAGVRDHGLNKAALGLWWGSGCPDFGACGCNGSKDLAQEFTCQMDHLQSYDIPVGVYLFDGSAWSARNSSLTGSCSGSDCCSWKLGDAVIERMAQDHVRGLLHFWGGCHTAEQYDRAQKKLGRTLLGFYLDDGSDDDEVNGVNEFMRDAAPGNWETVAKAYQNREPSTSNAGLSRLVNLAYVGDLPYTFAGMQEGFTRVIAKAGYMPAPFNEFTGYAYENPGAPDEETFIRRLHYGAFQPIMAHTPYGNSDPWRPEYSPALLTAFRYYTWLHKELGPYFLSYAIRMHQTPTLPVLRAGPGSYTLRVGNEIFVPLVTGAVSTLSFRLPGGSWVDYWDEQRVVTGQINAQPIPLGREPIFFRLGAIIPMSVERDYTGHGTRESEGSLTVLVYPNATSTFRYYEDATATWTTFTSAQSGDALTLTADPPPSDPVLYRIARVDSRPASVGIDGSRVLVNQAGDVPEVNSEAKVNAAPGAAWYYDAGARRLIIKAPY